MARIRGLVPDAKSIFMRNPGERPYSFAIMHLRNLEVTGRGAEATADGPFFESFFRQPSMVSHTSYLRSLEKWRRFYPDEQIFVGFLEDIHFHPVRLLHRLYGLLEVDPSHAREAKRRKINPGAQENMPIRVAARSARTYHKDLQRLSTRFGGYAYFWLYGAGKLVNGTLDEDKISYPLWKSRLWEEWKEEPRPFAPPGTQDGEV